jgi:hypothetical protein
MVAHSPRRLLFHSCGLRDCLILGITSSNFDLHLPPSLMALSKSCCASASAAAAEPARENWIVDEGGEAQPALHDKAFRRVLVE